jgi:hypothetical protein
VRVDYAEEVFVCLRWESVTCLPYQGSVLRSTKEEISVRFLRVTNRGMYIVVRRMMLLRCTLTVRYDGIIDMQSG